MAVKRMRRALNALDVSSGGYNFNHFPGNCSSQNVALKTLVNVAGRNAELWGVDFIFLVFFSSFFLCSLCPPCLSAANELQQILKEKLFVS